MSNLVGTVHFRSTLDGRDMPEQAQKMGRDAGLSGGKAFNEQWDKEFEKGLTAAGRKTLASWKKRGNLDGLAYGAGLEAEFKRFAGRLSDAFADFQGISVNSSFMDELGEKSRNVEGDLTRLRESLELLHRQGGITDYQFRTATATMDDWARSQREASINAELDRVAVQRQAESMRDLREELERHARARQNVIDVEREHARSIGETNREWVNASGLLERITLGVDKNGDAVKGLSFKWQDISHNTRQWTLIIGAVTAAIPELAGLSSAAGSGLFVLAGAATAAGVGLTATISSIVGLNKDLADLPDNLRPARAGLDDFKASFSDLNTVITEAAFLNSEDAWRSLGATVRGLGPAFSTVGATVGELLDDLAENVAPGTKNFENLSGVVEKSAPLFDKLARSAGRLGEGLIAAFNDPSMQRSMNELLDYIDQLSDSFADFLEGGSLDDWLRHGTAVFGSFGDLLATTGGLLNDLVTDASINRLTTFMDNLGRFLDTGGRGILQFADEFNAFGLIADLLAEVGEALEPLREPIVDLAAALNEDLIAAFDGLGMTLGVIATGAAPVVQAIADIFDAIPPEAATVIGGTAAGLVALYGALRAIQGAQAVIPILTGVATEGGKATTALGRLGARAGLVGVALVAGVAGFEAILEASRDIAGVDETVRGLASSNADLVESFNALYPAYDGGARIVSDWGAVLDRVGSTQNQMTTGVRNLGLAWDEEGQTALALIGTLNELDKPLAQIANTSLSNAQAQFRAYGESVGASDEQMMAMLNEMPEFKAVLDAVAVQSGVTASNQDLLALAMGKAASEADGASSSARDNAGELQAMGEQARLTEDQVDSLADAIRGFGDASLSSRDAQRQFEAALDDLTASVGENGLSLDINTEQGRSNEAALDAIAEAARDAAASKLELTGSEADATSEIQRGRDALIEQLGQFGITGQAAQDYADQLGLIPDDVLTALKLTGADQVKSQLNDLAKDRYVNIIPRGSTFGRLGPMDAMASGGVLTGPRTVLAGEDGPEAIVPLNRALSRVDPTVRWLSAIAQNKTPAMAGGGVVGGGTQVTFEAGAIVVQGATDSRATALEVVDAISERISS